MPSTIETLHQDFKAQGLTVWAVDIQEPRALVAGWVEANRVTVPVLLDSNAAAARAYRVTGTPTVVLVGRDGQLVARGVGTRAWTGDKGRALIAALLSSAAR